MHDIPQVIEALIQSHGSRVMVLLARVLGDPEEARDVYQDTWTSVWRALSRLEKGIDPWPYIRRAALSKAIDRLRARRHTVTLDPEAVASAATPRSSRAAPDIDLAFLDPRERACLTLFFWEGRTIREIAAQLDVPEGTVKTWMFRARAVLRERLK